MTQENINEICKSLGIKSIPISNLNLPSEEEMEKIFDTCKSSLTYDDEWEQTIVFNGFKSGYIVSEIKKHIK